MRQPGRGGGGSRPSPALVSGGTWRVWLLVRAQTASMCMGDARAASSVGVGTSVARKVHLAVPLSSRQPFRFGSVATHECPLLHSPARLPPGLFCLFRPCVQTPLLRARSWGWIIRFWQRGSMPLGCLRKAHPHHAAWLTPLRLLCRPRRREARLGFPKGDLTWQEEEYNFEGEGCEACSTLPVSLGGQGCRAPAC